MRNNHRAEHRVLINLVKCVLISEIERSITRFDRKRNDMADSCITRHPAYWSPSAVMAALTNWPRWE